MNRKRSTDVTRFALSAAIALPMTVALLFLMTRLILPSEQDRIVTRMIQNIEFHRTVRPPDPAGILVFALPQAIEENPPSTEPKLIAAESHQSDGKNTLSDENFEKVERARVIDWWAEARRLTQESNDEAFRRWLLEQGYDSYVSIMQGPIPITNSVGATPQPTQEDATGYLNGYGDLEYKISENCVATTQVAARFDQSDFGKALPMRVTCYAPSKQKFAFDRDDRE